MQGWHGMATYFVEYFSHPKNEAEIFIDDQDRRSTRKRGHVMVRTPLYAAGRLHRLCDGSEGSLAALGAILKIFFEGMAYLAIMDDLNETGQRRSTGHGKHRAYGQLIDMTLATRVKPNNTQCPDQVQLLYVQWTPTFLGGNRMILRGNQRICSKVLTSTKRLWGGRRFTRAVA